MRKYSFALSVALGLIGSVIAIEGAHAQSATACDAYARQYSQNASRQGQVLGRGAVGALVGTGIGAIAGDAGVGAAVGATIGGIGGGAQREKTADRMYSAAYEDCMAGRVP